MPLLPGTTFTSLESLASMATLTNVTLGTVAALAAERRSLPVSRPRWVGSGTGFAKK